MTNSSKLVLFGRAGELGASLAERGFEVQVSALETSPPTSDWVGVVHRDEWERARWLRPGRSWVVVTGGAQAPRGALSFERDLFERLPARQPTPEDDGWLGLAEVGLSVGNVIHNFNNVLSKGINLTELIALSVTDADTRAKLEEVIELLLEGSQLSSAVWGDLSAARRAQRKLSFADALWLSARGGLAEAAVSVGGAEGEALEVPLPATWVLGAALWDLMAGGENLSLTFASTAKPEVVSFGKLRSRSGYARLEATWRGSRSDQATARLERAAQRTRAGGRWVGAAGESGELGVTLYVPVGA